ncbi:MAG: hypothetical protein ACXWZL_02925 [Mycobacterium sp.]
MTAVTGNPARRECSRIVASCSTCDVAFRSGGAHPSWPRGRKKNYGPTIATYRFNEDDAERTAALDRDFLTLLEKWNEATEPCRTVYAAEYLLVTATKG